MESLKYLEPLLDGTPLAVERIKVAWPGLSVSDRAYLLTVLLSDPAKEKKKALRWPHHRKCLVDLALTDDNAYIRYLAAKDVPNPYWFGGETTPGYLEDKARFEKVRSDTLPIVRFANMAEGTKILMREFENPELFWKRPQTERLALVNGVNEYGKEIAELFRYATKVLLPANVVTLEEMLDVLLQYVNWKAIKDRVADSVYWAQRSWDGLTELDTVKDVEALWGLIPDLPDALSYVLIQCLPEEADWHEVIPSHVIESLSERQLETLLWRRDIGLKGVRRKVYEESTNENLRCAALASDCFTMSDAVISGLVYDPTEPLDSRKRKIEELQRLATYWGGGTLVQMETIHDLISNAYDLGFSDLDGINAVRANQTRRAKQLSPYELKSEILAMQLFSLAETLSPIRERSGSGGLPEALISRYKLGQHKELIVPRNPWQTYLNLRKVVDLDHWEQTIGPLPGVSIPDVDLPENEPVDEPSDNPDGSHQDLGQLFNIVKDIQDQVKDIAEKQIDHMHDVARSLGNMSETTRGLFPALSNTISAVSNQITLVQALQSRKVNNILLCLIAAALLLLFFKIK